MSTIGSSFNTLLAVYTGASVSALNSVASNIGGGGNGTSKLTFNATAGTTYRIAVDGVNSDTPATGSIVLNVGYAYYFSTLAGSAGVSGSVNGTGSTARFNGPNGVAVDSSGNVFVADTSNNTIRMITTGGVVTTLVGTAGSSGSADGTGAAALFSFPVGVAVDSSGNVFVADTANNTIRKITAGGVVTTPAGTASSSGSADGTGAAALFNDPTGVAADSSGNVFVADTVNNTIRKITAGGVVTTLAGTAGSFGSADGTGAAALFNSPNGVAADSSGNVFVADTANNTIRKITAGGVVTTLAGTAGSSGSADGTGAAALFSIPVGVAVDSSGNVFVADRNNKTIRKITASGVVTTLAGTAGSFGSADGTGAAALFNNPVGVAVDSSGNVFVADTNNHTIRFGTPAVAPSISAQPLNVATTAGNNASFSVTAGGAGTVSYQWYKNGVAISGNATATTSTLTLSNVQFSDVANYSVTVTNAFGLSTSSVATLGPSNAAPTIITQPTDQSVTVSQSAAFSINATGSGTLTYKVRRNGTTVVATGSSPSGTPISINLTNSASQSDADYYDILVIDGLASTKSNVVRLGVAPTAYPTNIEIDPTFNLPAENANFFSPNVVASHNNGSNTGILVGGDVVRVNGTPVRRLVRFNADGTPDSTFCANAAIIGFTVNALVEQTADHKILVGGQFGFVDGVAHVNIARLNADGTIDSSFTPFISGFYVNAIALQSDGKILVGGNFSQVNGSNRANLARLNSDGTLDSTFNPNVSGGEVKCLAVQPPVNGVQQIVLGGVFTTVNGTARGRIARLNSDGTLDTGFASGVGFDASVNAVALDSTGRVIAGGNFTSYNGGTANRIARLLGGSLDSANFTSGTGFSFGNVNTLAVQSDDKVVCGGTFSVFNDNSSFGVARLNTNGGFDNTFAPGLNGSLNSLFVDGSGNVVLGGVFTTVGGNATARVARVSSGGVRDTTVNATFRSSGSVARILPLPNHQVLAVGNFTHIGANVAGGVARFTDTSGTLTLDTTFNSGGTGASGTVNAAALMPDGKIVIGGSFTFYGDNSNTYTTPNLARLNSDGTFDSAFNVAGSGPNSTVWQLAAASGGGVYVGGTFTSYIGTSVPAGLIRANPDGSLDTGFGAGTTAFNFNNNSALAVQRDGKLLVGTNSVITIGGNTVTRCTRLNTDGSIDVGFNANLGISFDNAVDAIAVQPDGTIVVGGAFTTLNGSSVNHLARLTADGLPDSGFNNFNNTPTTGANNTVYSLLRQEDGKLVAFGVFFKLDNQNNTTDLGRLAASGAFDSTFALYGALNQTGGNFSALYELDDGSVLVGNNTMAFNATERIGLVHFKSLAAPTFATQPTSTTANAGDNKTFTAAANGSAFNTYQWYFNGAAIPGATNPTLTLNSVTFANAGSYFVTVTNTLGSITSNTVTLSGTSPAPVINTQPQNTTVVAGTTGPTLSVAAALGSGSSGTLAYQWRRNGFPIAGATSASLSLTGASVTDSDLYDVLVIDGLTLTASQPARLTIVPTAFPQGLRVDPTFNPIVESDFAQISAIAVDTSSGANGRFYVAGQFNRIAGVYRNRLARFNGDGTFDNSWTPTFINGNVNALAVQPTDGKIIIGGNFTIVGSVNRNFVARLNADGTLDSGFYNNNSFFNNGVNALVLQADGKIVIGGFFNTYFSGGTSTTRNGLARLNTDGSLDTFDAALNSNATVNALLLSGTNLLVGGTFTNVGATARNNVALVDSSGALVGTFNPGAGTTAAVLALAKDTGSGFLLGGNFTSYNGTGVGRIAHVDATGTLDNAFNNVTSGTGFTGTVNTLLVDGGGNIYVGGIFQNYGATSAARLARLTSAGALDTNFTTTLNSSASALAFGSDGKLIVGGSFTGVFMQGSATSTARKSLLRLGLDDGIYLPSGPNVTIRTAGTVNATALVPGGGLLIAGNFNWVNDTAANNVARFAAGGGLDGAFMTNVGTGFSGTVNSLVLQPDGKAVFGGTFFSINGASRNQIARLNADGSNDTTFTIGSGFNSSVSTVLPFGGGRLVVAGNFSSYNGTTRNGVLRLNSDGSLDSGFDPGTGPGGGTVNGATLLDDGRVVVFGNFTTFRGLTRAGVARLTTTGTDDGFDPGTGFTGNFPSLNSIAVQPDGKLLLGGNFSTYNSTARTNIARALTSGASDTGFTPNAAPNSNVNALVLEPQLTGAPRFIARGNFNSVGNFSVSRPLLARFNADGTLDPSLTVFGVNSGTSTFQNTERAVLTLDDGRVIVAGSGFNLEGQDHFGLARFITAVPPSVGTFATTPAGGEVRAGATVTITGANFLNVSGVLFGNVPATSFTVDSATQITAIVPTSAASNPITVVTPYGSSVSSAVLGVAPDLRLRSPFSTAAFLESIAFGNSAYVALGFPGDILRSTDNGTTWNLVFTNRPSTNGPRSVVFANNLFVAVGDNGTVLTSPDGATWTPRLSNTSTSFTGVTFGAGKFVAVSNSSTVITSADGINWFPVSGSTNTGLTSGLNSVAFGGSTFVGVGNNGVIYTSADGVLWSSASSPTANTLNRVAYVNSRFIAVGNNGTVLTSTAGSSWTLSSTPAGFSGASLFAVAYDGEYGKYVAAGFNNVFTSTDAINWSATNVPDLDIRSMVFNSTLGGIVAGGFPGSVFKTTDGEATWSLKNSLTHRNLRAAAAGNGHYVVVGNNGTFAHSVDGVAWTIGAIQSNASWSATDVAYGSGLFVTVGGGGVFLSPDGQTWSNQTPQNFDFSNCAVAYGGGRFVTVTSNGNSYRSSDGAAWSQSGALATSGYLGLAYGNSTFVAVGNNGVISTSSDGASWSTQTSGTAGNLQHVRYANGLFVAVGSNSTVLTSSNGTAWTPQTLGTSSVFLTDVAFGDGYWLAVSNSSSVYASFDNGVTWAALNPTSHVLSSALAVAFGNGRFVVVGNSGQLLSSNPAADTLLIATQPPSGDTSATSLTVAATGPATINYQWYQGVSGDTSNPVGTNSPTLTFGALSRSARYWVRVTSGTSVVDSTTATLLGAPSIVTQPQSIAVNELSPATFGVAAIGTPTLSYHWNFNGTPLTDGPGISGSTTPTLTLAPVLAANAGNYTVTVDNSVHNPITSNVATLTVNPIGPSIASAVTSLFGTNAVQSHTAGGPSAFIVGSPPITYQWLKNGTPLTGTSATGTVNASDFLNNGGVAPVSFFIANWQPGDAANYSLTLTNAQAPGGITTPAAPIYVNEESAWTVHTPLPTSDILTGVNVINGQFVITGVRGARFSTTDGASFTPLPSLSSNNSFAYAFGNGLHVLSGTLGSYATSTDGLTWISRHHGNGDANANSIVFGNGTFVMALESGQVLTSADAITWNSHTVAANTKGLGGLAFGNNTFLVANEDGQVFSSADALTWGPVTVPAAAKGLKYLNGQFVLGAAAGGGSTAALYNSSDGLSWSAAHTTNITSSPTDLEFGNGVYVLITDTGEVWSSAADLDHFTSRASGTTQTLNRIAYASAFNRFVAVGGSPGTPVVLTSTDGTNWNNTAAILANSNFNGIVANSGNSLVAVGVNGTIARVGTGGPWSQVTSGTNSNLNDVAFSGGTHIAVGNGGTILRSTTDGTSWTNVSSGTGFTLRFVGFVGGQWLAAGDNGTLLKSPDSGQTWSALTSGVTNQLLGVAFGNGTYVLVGSNGLIRTTGDLINWSSPASNTASNLTEVAFGNNTFVAVGSGGVIRTSTNNGASWTTRDPGVGDSFAFVGFTNGAFAASGGTGEVLLSQDGANWTARATGVYGQPSRFAKLAFFNNRIYGAGPIGTIASASITPAIAQAPTNITVAIGAPATFRVIGAGTAAPVRYQWFKEGVPISGATTAELNFSSVQLSDAARYTVSLTTDFGSVTSTPVLLTVNAPPTILASPVATTAIVGGNLTLNVGVSGSGPFTFTWQYLDPNIIEGSYVTVATTSVPQFTIPNFSTGNVGSYRVLVSNAFGTNIQSASVAVTAAATSSTWVVDPGFTRPQFRMTVPPSRVTPSPDGTKLYVTWVNGETLTGANNQRIGPILRFNNDTTGSLDNTFTSALAGLTDALAVAFQSNGQLLVGGVDAAENGDTGQTVYRVFRLNSDGSRDPSYKSPAFAGLPRFMTVQSDDKLLVSDAGSGNGPATFLRLNLNGARDLSFAPPSLDGGAGFIFANPVVDTSGRVLIGGVFSQVNGVARLNVARLNSNGSLDTSFVPSGYSTNGNTQVRGLAIQTLGGNAGKVLIIGGPLFVSSNNCAVLRLDGATGALDATFPTITQANAGMAPRTRSLTLNPADDSFMLLGAALAHYSANGVNDGAFTRSTFTTPTFNEFYWLAALPDGRLLVPVDEFEATVNGTPVAGVVRFNTNGSRDGTFAPGPVQNEIYSDHLIVQADNRPVLSGPFTTVNTTARTGLARFNLDGSLDSFALTGVANLLGVEGARVRSDGRYLARIFTGTSPATAIGDVKVFDANGALNAAAFTLDAAVAPVINQEDPDAELLADDSILLSSVTPQRVLDGATYFKHVLSNGTLDTSFSPSAITYGQVYRNGSNQVLQVVEGEFHLLAHYSDGRTLASVTVGSYPQNATSLSVTLRRFNANGTVDGTFSAPALTEPTVTLSNFGLVDSANGNANISVPVVQLDRSPIYSAQILPDNRILVITGFVAGFSSGGLSRLNSNGSVDTTFSVGTGAEFRYRPGRLAHINDVTVAPDGKYWVTGLFDTFNGYAAPGIVRLNANGSVDPTFAVDFAYRSFHFDDASLAFAPDGSVWLAGSYAKPGDLMPFTLTHLIVPTAAAITTPIAINTSVNAGGSITLSVTASGSPAPTYVWSFNGVPNGATGPSFTITNATQANAGVYTVTVSNPFTPKPDVSSTTLNVIDRSLLNLLSQISVPAKGAVSASFTIEGGTKNILIRGVGPSLTAITGALTDPRLTLLNASLATIASNDDWGTQQSVAGGPTPAASSAISTAITATGASPGFTAGSKDAALLVSLAPGTYTVVLDGVGGLGGTAQFEVVDADTGQWPRISMLAVRGPVTGSQHLVVGFNLTGTVSRNYLIRALSESLGSNQNGNNGVLSDSIMTLYQGAEQIDFDDDSNEDVTIDAAAASVGAQPRVSSGTLDSTIFHSLAPGSYAVDIAPYNGTFEKGEALFEIFAADDLHPAVIAPAITYLSLNQQAVRTGDAAFGVVAVSKPAATFQWRRNGVNLVDNDSTITGALSSVLHISNLQASDSGATFDVVVSNGTTSVTSPTRTLTVLPDLHSADTDHDGTISLVELTRVIQLYNYSVAGSRTGEYHTQASTEDGFAAGPGAITSYHSADTDHDGKISLTELMRVVLLFNYTDHNGVRTGQYHPEVGTEDGFAPGPFFLGGID